MHCLPHSIFVQMDILVEVLKMLLLSACVFHNLRITCLQFTHELKFFERDFVHWHSCHWQCHTLRSKDHALWLLEVGQSLQWIVWIFRQMVCQGHTWIKAVCLEEQWNRCSTWTLHPQQQFWVDSHQGTWRWHQLQLLISNLPSKSWTHCGKCILVANDWHQHPLDMCNNRFHP